MKRTLIAVIILALLSGSVLAADFKWARAKYRLSGERQDSWNDESSADSVLLKAVQKFTTIKLNPEVKVVELTSLDEMCKYPFIFFHAQTAIVMSDAEAANIREYLERGGFIFVDDCVLSESTPDIFFQSMKKELSERVCPDWRMEKLANDHPIYTGFYAMKNGVPTIQGRNWGGWALFDKQDRMKAFLASTDLNCGWNPDYFPGQKNSDALKMGINVVIYALTH